LRQKQAEVKSEIKSEKPGESEIVTQLISLPKAPAIPTDQKPFQVKYLLVTRHLEIDKGQFDEFESCPGPVTGPCTL
jgi:hypothetical protein